MKLLKSDLAVGKSLAISNVRKCDCGATLRHEARFCPRCGVPAEADVALMPVVLPRAGLVRRMAAEVIDRMLPLPFLAYFFPVWIFAVMAYHLICDGTPSGQSVGKWICRLRVISVYSQEPCGIGRAMLRRFTTALGQAAYCLWMMIPFIVAYELASLALAWISPTGRRLEDYLAGTQVITEGAYRNFHHACNACGRRFPRAASYCPQCGHSAI